MFTGNVNQKACEQQAKVLHTIMVHIRNTAFGQHYGLRKRPDAHENYHQLTSLIPLTTYDDFYDRWIRTALSDRNAVIWDEDIKYVALTSGTGTLRHKQIPYTERFIHSLIRSSRSLIPRLIRCGVSWKTLTQRVMTIGGSTTVTALNQASLSGNAHNPIYQGFMSGIIYREAPSWYHWRNVPGPDLHALTDWPTKMDRIASEAIRYRIGMLTGFPSYVLPLLKMIIRRHHLKTIHDIWPDLRLYIHSGVSLGHYKDEILSCFGKPVDFYETYYATEGFFGHSPSFNHSHFKLMASSGVYYEFVELNAENFDADGTLLPTARALNLSQIRNDVPYALVVSNYCGLMRLLQGDVVTFVDVENLLFRLEGRLSETLNVSGEIIPLHHIKAEINHYLTGQGLTNISNHFMTVDQHPEYSLYRFYFVSDALSPNQMAGLDQYLSTQLMLYRSYRKDGLLGHAEIGIISEKVYESFLNKVGILNGQGKMPYYLTGTMKERFVKHLSNK